MIKNIGSKIIVLLSMASFNLACGLAYADIPNYGLQPMSLREMYSLAQSGNVRALRYATQRGLNIDARDRNGNTGLCHAVYRNDYTAYNAFRAAGADPRSNCTQAIPKGQYERFMASSRVADPSLTSRQAYNLFDEGEYIVSDRTWWTAGLLLAGGGLAWALTSGGGGGGGGGGSAANANESLAKLIGKNKPKTPGEGYVGPIKYKVSGNTKVNMDDFEMKNDSEVEVSGGLKSLTELINLNSTVLKYTDYISSFMKAMNSGTVINGEDDGTNSVYVKLNNNTSGLTALKNSSATNYGNIEIFAQNGALGMVAGDNSVIDNSGIISVFLLGDDTSLTNNRIIGMYGDTKSSIINKKDIKGVGEVNGTLVGMEGRIINQEKQPNINEPTKVVNKGHIQMGITAEDVSLTTTLYGMTSSIEQDFLDGKKRINKAGFVSLENDGDIYLNLSIVDAGSYDSDIISSKGSSGVVGIRANVNTTAINRGKIDMSLNDARTDNSSLVKSGTMAGMLAIHGGNIRNEGDISIIEGAGNYGMLAIRGSGQNNEIDQRAPTLYNSDIGNIVIDSLNGFGMANYFITGGLTDNYGSIHLKQVGTGILSTTGTASNHLSILLDKSGVGMSMTDKGNLNNIDSADITIRDADGATGMMLNDGNAYNKGSVSIIGNGTNASYGIYANNGVVTNEGTITIDAISSFGIYSDAAKIFNEYVIEMKQSGNGTYSMTGDILNNGQLNMRHGGTGIYTDSGKATNSGTVTVYETGIGMSTRIGQIINGDVIKMKTDGYGMNVVETGKATNLFEINMEDGGVGMNNTANGELINDAYGMINMLKGGKGINAGSGKATNKGLIEVNSTLGNADGIYSAGNATILNDENAYINIHSDNSRGINVTNSKVDNKGIIIIGGKQSSGIMDNGGSTVTNSGDINLTDDATDSYGIKTGVGGTATNSGIINVDSTGSAAMLADGGTIINDILGSINVSKPSSSVAMLVQNEGIAYNYGDLGSMGLNVNGFKIIHVKSGTAYNSGTIGINGSNSYAMYAEGGTAYNLKNIFVSGTSGDDAAISAAMFSNGTGAVVQNESDAIITVLDNSPNYATGMKARDGGTATNKGKIIVEGDGYGMYADLSNPGLTYVSQIQNDGEITMKKTDMVGIYAQGGNVMNNITGKIIVEKNGYGIKLKKSSATNSGIISVGDDTSSSTNYGIYLDGVGTASNSASGTININGGAGGTSGILVENDGSAENYGAINALNGLANISGMTGKNSGNVANYGTIDVTGFQNRGMLIIGTGNAQNNGSINLKVENDDPNWWGSSNGMRVEGTGTATNNNKITINDLSTTRINTVRGMELNGAGSITNAANGKILINSTYGSTAGMHAKGGGTASNAGNITLNLSGITDIYGMSIDGNNGGNISNTGSININLNSAGEGSSVNGMTALGSNTNISNSGTITITGNISGAIPYDRKIRGIYISGTNSTALNQGTIKLPEGIGIWSDWGSTTTNSGTITFENGIGMGAYNNSTVENSTTGIISLTKGIGMSADNSSKITNAGKISANVTSGSINGIYTKNNGTALNSGNIVIDLLGQATIFGMIADGNNGGYLTNSNNITINLNSAGPSTLAFGMRGWGDNTRITNSGTISITGTVTDLNPTNLLSDKKVVGMYVKDINSTAINNGTINISEGVGMFAEWDATATNNGTINVGKGIGMFSNYGATIINTENGIINVVDGYGMYANNYAKIVNYGRIVVSGNNISGSCDSSGTAQYSSCSPWFELGSENSPNWRNYAVSPPSPSPAPIAPYAGVFNFDDYVANGGQIAVASGGSFEAKAFAGTVHADVSIVQKGFETTYRNKNSFIGESDELNIQSNSALFSARLEQNEEGNTDVVMEMNNINQMVDNQAIATYIARNYALATANEDDVAVIKGAANRLLLNNAVAKTFGIDVIPNFAKENMDTVKSLSMQINDRIFAEESVDEVRVMAGYDFFYRNADKNGNSLGYKDQAHSGFVVADKKHSETFRYGLGLGLTRLDSDYDDSSSRHETIVQAFAPFEFDWDSLKLLSTPRIGYGFGKYEREGTTGKFDADTKNYYYGITNELRKEFDVKIVTLEPTFEFNVLGLYQDKTKEDGAIEVAARDNLSVEGGIGLYAKREFKFANEGKLRFRFGGTYYHEFNDPYKSSKASSSGWAGLYNMEGYNTSRNRGVLSLKAEYEQNMLTFYLQLNQYIEDADAYSFNAGLGYRF